MELYEIKQGILNLKDIEFNRFQLVEIKLKTRNKIRRLKHAAIVTVYR